MYFSSGAQYALLLLPAGVLSAVTGRPMIAGRTHQPVTNSSSLATPTKVDSQKSTTKPDLSTITSTSSWDGNGTIPSVYCPSAPAPGWCRVSVGTVQLNFWPTGAATRNHTYPSTKYLPEYNHTMTSPWVYFAINTMIATDWCGNLIGTTLTNVITSYAITEVSTLQPFLYTTGKQRVGPAQQLKLSDLKLDCPLIDVTNQTYEEIGHSFIKGEFDPGCNPDLVWPLDLKRAAGGVWNGCGRHDGGGLGIFDPPVPVSACPDNDPQCLYEGAAMTTTLSPLPINTALPDQAQSTTTTAAPLPAVTSSEPVNTGLPEAPDTSSNPSNPQTSPVAHPESTEEPANSGLPADTANAPGAAYQETSSVANSMPTESPSNPGSPGGPQSSPDETSTETNSETEPVAIATLAGSNVISATAGASYVVVGSQTATLGGATVTFGDQIVQLQSSAGLVVQNTADESLSTYTIPTAPSIKSTEPVAIATLAGLNVISATAGASYVVVGSQTATLGGPPVTVAGQVIQLQSSAGLVVQNTADGSLSTYTIPTAPSIKSTEPVAIATLAGADIISATAGASYVVIGSQTATLGGPPVTVAGQVIQLQSSAGLVVQNTADGSFLTYAIPTAAPSSSTIGQSLAVYEGQTISGLAVASSVAVIGGQTLSVGGSVVTLPGSQVASLGSSGIVVEAPGGGVTTIAVPSPTSTAQTNVQLTKVFSTGSPTSSIPPASTSIGALIMANLSSGSKPRELGGNLVTWIGYLLAAAVFFL